MEKRSFTRFWLIIAGAFLLVVVIFITWFVSLQITRNEVLEKYNQQQLFLAEGTANGIEGLFDDLAASLRSLGTLPEIQSFDEQPTRSQLARKLDELAPLGITDIGILDAAGTARFFATERDLEGIDYSWRTYFKEAQAVSSEAREPSLIVERLAFGPGETGFMIAIPFFANARDISQGPSEGDFSGVITGKLTLDALVQRYLVPFKPPGNGHIFLVTPAYDVVWSSDENMLQANLLERDQVVFSGMVNQMAAWNRDTVLGEYYTFTRPGFSRNADLIAFSPVRIGQEVMGIGVKTPGNVASQTSFSNFRSQQWVLVGSVLTILVGVLVGGFELRREIRKRFQAEEALRKSETEQAIIAERNRLAGDLHDSVTQGLYGIVLHADAAIGQLSAGKIERAEEFLEEIKDAGKEGLAEMRLLIFELRPPVLAEDGLAAALETRLYGVERRAGLKTNIQVGLDSRLPVAVEDGLYRIAQEALNNALKHAHAQNIRVYLAQSGSIVTLEIEDDGRGFEIQSGIDSGGIGLANMAERVASINGKMNIEAQPNAGTRIKVEVKL